VEEQKDYTWWRARYDWVCYTAARRSTRRSGSEIRVKRWSGVASSQALGATLGAWAVLKVEVLGGRNATRAWV
jgi:hypothetical protein